MNRASSVLGWLHALRDERKDFFAPDALQPFNDQRGRQNIVRDLLAAIPFELIIETGTFRTATTRHLHEMSGLPVRTVEVVPRFYHFARRRFRETPNVSVYLGDSRAFLRSQSEDEQTTGLTTFFYLDAHWYEDLPLADEVALIVRSWTNFAIMVDDFRVDDDSDYGFDDYGPGRALSLDLLRPVELGDANLFWPSLQGNQETGARRGCLVIASPGRVAERAAKLDLLRPAASG